MRVMYKKMICMVIRIITLTSTLIILRQLYEVDAFGCFIVCLTGVIWAVTGVVDADKE